MFSVCVVSEKDTMQKQPIAVLHVEKNKDKERRGKEENGDVMEEEERAGSRKSQPSYLS